MHISSVIWSFIVQFQLYRSLATSQASPSTIGNDESTGSVNLQLTWTDQLDSHLLTPSASDLSSGATLITGLHVTKFFDRTNIVYSDLTTNTANIVYRNLTTNTANIVHSDLTTNTANMVMPSSLSIMFKQPDISSQKILETSSAIEPQSSEKKISLTSQVVRDEPLGLTFFSTVPVKNLQSVSTERSFFVSSDIIAAEPSKMSAEPIGTESNSVLVTIEPDRAIVPTSGELELATTEQSRAVVPSPSELENTRTETSTLTVLSSAEVVLARTSIDPTLLARSSFKSVISSSSVSSDILAAEPSKMSAEPIQTESDSVLAAIEPSRTVVPSSSELELTTTEPSRAVVSSSSELELTTTEPSRVVVSSSSELELTTTEPSRAVMSSSSELDNTRTETSTLTVLSSAEVVLARTSIDPTLLARSSFKSVISSSSVSSDILAAEPSKMSAEPIQTESDSVLAAIEPSRTVVPSSSELELTTTEPSRAVVSSSSELELTTTEPSRVVVSSSSELELTTTKPSRAVVSSSSELELTTTEPSRAVMSSSSELDNTRTETSTLTVLSSGEVVLSRTSIEPTLVVRSSFTSIFSSRKIDTPSMTLAESFSVVTKFTAYTLVPTLFETISASGAMSEKVPSMSGTSADFVESVYVSVTSTKSNILDTFSTYIFHNTANSVHGVESMSSLETSEVPNILTEMGKQSDTISSYSHLNLSVFRRSWSLLSLLETTIVSPVSPSYLLITTTSNIYSNSINATSLLANGFTTSHTVAEGIPSNFHQTLQYSFSSITYDTSRNSSSIDKTTIYGLETSVNSQSITSSARNHMTWQQAYSLSNLSSSKLTLTSGEISVSIETVRPSETYSSSVQSQASQSITFSNVSEASSHTGLPSVTHPITRSIETTGHSELMDLSTSFRTMSYMDSVSDNVSGGHIWLLSTVEFPKSSDGFNLATTRKLLTTVQSPALGTVYSTFSVNDSAVLNLTSSGTILVRATSQTSTIPVINTSSAVIITSSFQEVSSLNVFFSTGFNTLPSLRMASSEIKLDYFTSESSNLPLLSIPLDTISVKTKPFTASIISSSLTLPEIFSSPILTVSVSEVMVVTAFPTSIFSLVMVNNTYSAYKITPSTSLATVYTTNAEGKTISVHPTALLFSSFSSVVMSTNTVEGTTFLLPSEMILPSTTILVSSSPTNSSFVSVLNTNDTSVLLSTMFSTLGSTIQSNSSFIKTSANTMTTTPTIFLELTSTIGTVLSELTPSAMSGNTDTKNISEKNIITSILSSLVITETGTAYATSVEGKTISIHLTAISFSSFSSVLMPTNTVKGTTFLLPSEMILPSTTILVFSSSTNSSFVSVLNTDDTSVLLSSMFSTLESTTISNSSFIVTSALAMTTIRTIFPELTSTISTILSELTPSSVPGNTSTKNISENTVITPIAPSSVITKTGTGTPFPNSTLIADLTTSSQMSTPSTMTTVTMATSHSPILDVTSSTSIGSIMPSSVSVTSTNFMETTSLLTNISLLTTAWSSLPLTSFLHMTDKEVFQSSSVTPTLTSHIVSLTASSIASSALTSSLNVTLISTSLYITEGITVMPTSVFMTRLITLDSDTVTTGIFSTSVFNNVTANLTWETTTVTTDVVFSNVTEVVSTNVSINVTLETSTFSMSVPSSYINNVSATNMTTLSTPTTATTTILTSLATSATAINTTVEPTTTTTTIPPSRAPRNITEAGENYWVVTVLKVSKTKNISSPTFRSGIEAGLAQAYFQAYYRKELIQLGMSDQLKKRRRRRKKRYTKYGDTAIHVQRISQDAGTSVVSVAYSVENNGSVVPAVDAVNTLALMDIQELAILLKEVVSTKADTYIKPVSPGGDTAEAGGLAAWVIGAIAGGVAALIIIIFVVACCYFKCCREPKKTDIEGQPQLVGLKKPLKESLQEGEPEFVVTHADPEYLEQLSKQASKASLLSQKSRKSQRYEVTQPKVEEKTPVKKHDLSRSKTSNIIEVHSEGPIDTKAGEGVISPSKRRNNKLKESNLLNDQIPGPEDSQLLHRSLSDEDEELKQKAEMERKLNKERIRAKIKERRSKEKNQGQASESLRDYFKTWDEIDRVLEAPAENGLPHVFVDSSRKKKKKDEELGQSNEGFTSEEETLEEARKRMHQLLNDTFSLISPKASYSELGQPAGSLSPGSAGHEPVKEEMTDDDTAHTPMYVTPFTRSEPILETWSPYRASDQVALISMPKLQQTTIKSSTTQPQTKPIKRPVASFPEPSTVASQEQKYTTSPPKPIVITSRELLKPSTLDEQRPVSAQTLISNVSKGLKNPSLGKLSYSQINGNDTNLLKSDHLMTNGNAGSYEMKMLKNSQGQRRKHKLHGHEPKNSDEIDIITNNLKPGESTADYIRSIRNEVQHKPDSMGPQRKLRSSMTDIV